MQCSSSALDLLLSARRHACIGTAPLRSSTPVLPRSSTPVLPRQSRVDDRAEHPRLRKGACVPGVRCQKRNAHASTRDGNACQRNITMCLFRWPNPAGVSWPFDFQRQITTPWVYHRYGNVPFTQSLLHPIYRRTQFDTPALQSDCKRVYVRPNLTILAECLELTTRCVCARAYVFVCFSLSVVGSGTLTACARASSTHSPCCWVGGQDCWHGRSFSGCVVSLLGVSERVGGSMSGRVRKWEIFRCWPVQGMRLGQYATSVCTTAAIHSPQGLRSPTRRVIFAEISPSSLVADGGSSDDGGGDSHGGGDGWVDVFVDRSA